MSRPLRITILGGTGTLGQALVAQLLDTSPNCDITIVSRDEHKQAAMKKRYPQCRFVVGDIRDAGSVRQTFTGRDVVFHVAALKHVDILEACPMESIKTNVLATEQMARLAISQKVPRFVFSSTDKAVDPINTYGYSKALSEKLLWNFNREQSGTQFSVYRWGNVLGSQGSAIPFFIDTLIKESKVYLTDLEMTRYWIPIEWAVRYMLRTFPDAK
jgi:FlaA1/EpsC-like NDP-sugar epimerase